MYLDTTAAENVDQDGAPVHTTSTREIEPLRPDRKVALRKENKLTARAARRFHTALADSLGKEF
jgi:hypothetical protein